jgi:hypothetical protein
VNSALLHYRTGRALEIVAGRDQLPSGINVPGSGTYIKARNRAGEYDTPTQIKLFAGGGRYQIVPFAYRGGTNEPRGEAEIGGGSLAEVDLLGRRNTVVGVLALRGRAEAGARDVIGAYARLGFGRWGILGEHDITRRTRRRMPEVSFRQQASYGQVFVAVREWLVPSVIGEHLHVSAPFEESRTSARLEVTARLASQITVGVGARLERNHLTGQLSRSVVVQSALKTAR